MENFERTHFVVLTGHLDDRPLPDLVRTLRAQRKTGRLQIEYPDAPGSFFFEEGQLVDAQLGDLRGLEALYAAVSMRGAAFNFNPLVRPPERRIDRQQQKFITDLIEAERRESLPEVAAEGRTRPTAVPFPARPEPPQLGPAAAELIAPLEQRLTAVEMAITTGSRRFSRERLIYAAVILFLTALVIGTLLQVTYNSPSQGQTAPLSQRSPQQGDAKPAPAATTQPQVQATPAAAPADDVTTNVGGPGRGHAGARQTPSMVRKTEAAARQTQAPRPATAAEPEDRQSVEGQAGGGGQEARSGHVVQVLMEVKNGQVTSARVVNPRPGAAEYEALALRMARQRRYPETFNGADRLRLRVKP